MKRRIDIEPGELDSLSAYVSETWRRFPEDRDPNRAPDPPGEDELHANPEQALRRFRQLSSRRTLPKPGEPSPPWPASAWKRP